MQAREVELPDFVFIGILYFADGAAEEEGDFAGVGGGKRLVGVDEIDYRRLAKRQMLVDIEKLFF